MSVEPIAPQHQVWPQRQVWAVAPDQIWQVWQQLRRLSVPAWVDPRGCIHVVLGSKFVAKQVERLFLGQSKPSPSIQPNQVVTNKP